MKKTYEATGKTREEAIAAGLEALNLTIGEVTVEDIEEGSKGLFGLFGSRPWRVRVTAIEDEKPALDTHSLFADSLEMLNDKAPNDQVIKLKALEAMQKVADGKATKIIIPSEMQGLVGLANGIVEGTKQ